jgi:ABC-type amino acid transport substrate-binding protein
VRDDKRELFGSIDRLRAQKGLRIAVLRGVSVYEDQIRRLLPEAEIVRLDKFEDFFHASGENAPDALVTLAMIGTAYTLLNPSYSVIVPKPVIRIPVAMALPRNDPVLKAYLDNWLLLNEESGRLRKLYDHWVLGKDVAGGGGRWSVIKDVLGWVD